MAMRAWPTAERNQRIRELRSAGLSYKVIGERYGLSYQRVSEIVKSVPGGERMRQRGPFHCPECSRVFVFPSGIHWHLYKAHQYTHNEARVWIEHDEIMRGIYHD